jgi:hypothetical protein
MHLKSGYKEDYSVNKKSFKNISFLMLKSGVFFLRSMHKTPSVFSLFQEHLWVYCRCGKHIAQKH